MPNTAVNTTITIDLPKALKADVDAHKAKTGAPQAFIVRQALIAYLAAHQIEQQQKEAA